jgi:hypothetical protein
MPLQPLLAKISDGVAHAASLVLHGPIHIQLRKHLNIDYDNTYPFSFYRNVFLDDIYSLISVSEHAANLPAARQTSAQDPRIHHHASTRFPPHLAAWLDSKSHARRDTRRDMRIRRRHCSIMESAICTMGFVAF